MQLLVHIGTHKAGSTAIQKFCTVAAEELAANSIHYPVGIFERYPNQHSELLPLLRPDRRSELEGIVQRFIEGAERAGMTRIFLSGEDLCSGANDDSVALLADVAHRRFSKVEIVCVVRNRIDYLASHYAHFLRHHAVPFRVTEFSNGLQFNPSEVVARWSQYFEAENVHVEPFESPDGNELLERFFSRFLGIHPSEEQLLACRGANASLDMLTSYLVNDVLKVLPAVRAGVVHEAYRAAFGGRPSALPALEADVATLVDSLSSDEGWADLGLAGDGRSRRLDRKAFDTVEATSYLRGLAQLIAEFLAIADSATIAGTPQTVTRRDVVEAYRVLLDREPESEDVVDRALAYRTKAALRSAMLESPEFQNKNPTKERLNNVPTSAPAIDVQTVCSPHVMERLFRHIQTQWVRLGEQKPHWSVLSNPVFQGDVTPELEERFYQSATEELESLLATIDRAGRRTSQITHTFEFGCGLGRVTMKLAETFEKVTACDISGPHLEGTSKRARHLGHTNIDLRHATVEDFGISTTYDLWYSRLVLQHNPPPIIKAVVARALRYLNPGGLAIFQVPTYSVGYTFDVDTYLERLDASPEIEVHCIPQSHIFDLAQQAGCRVVEVREDNSLDIPRFWVSNMFVIERVAA